MANSTGSGNRLGLGIALGALVLLHLNAALALGIGVGRTPAPPKAIVNDGFGVEAYNWSIEFESTPDHYLEFILDPHNNLKKCVFHDLSGWTPVPPPPWDSCTYVDESAGWPQAGPLVGASSWTAPSGAMLGRYEIRIQYFSLEGGEPWEAEGAVTFYVAQATGSLQFFKFRDLNANGIADPGEPGIPNWKISFKDPFGTTFHRLTNASGFVQESSVPVGSYDVWETLKTGWINTTSLMLTKPVVTDQTTRFLFGNYLLGSIGDTVWLDANKDGVFDDDENGFDGVVLHLFMDGDENGVFETLVSSETTNPFGWYLFDNLPAGSYMVEVDETSFPGGQFVLTTPPEPREVMLATEENFLDADFGYYQCHEEECNGLDDDCDGHIDEDFPLSEACDGDDSDLCANGHFVCNPEPPAVCRDPGSCPSYSPVVCVDDVPSDIIEICDGIDNDCDGDIDEDFPVGEPCDGNDLDRCENGTFTCDASGDVECINETSENIPELCNSFDDDCDGLVDEDFPLLGLPCDGADSDLCANGVYICLPPSICRDPGNCNFSPYQCVNDEPANIIEICDGFDNDCDGSLDEDLGATTCGVGACTVTVQNCVDGQWVNCVPGNPAAEVCDLVDNDCDGAVDENLGSTTCGVGACTATVQNCIAGQVPACIPGDPVAEVCDLVDNDCDGTVDEGLGTTTCGAGICQVTSANCVDGQLQNCVPGNPGTEACDGLDNDCDGAIDEELGSTTCGVGTCITTVQNCVDGQVQTCVPGNPGTEVCDGSDNDCDGAVDENLGTTTCGVGACITTVENCIDGQVQTCTPTSAAEEICDELDNDCDGLVDEDLGTTTCGVGECQVTVDNCGTGSPDLEAFGAALPGQVQFILTHPGTGFGLPSYYDVQILGTSVLAGTFDDYCIDTDNYIQPGTTYTANVFSSYDALPAGIIEHPENFDLVNYIINQDYVGTPAADGNLFTYGDVQRSIWDLLDDGQTTNGLGPWTQAHVDQILEEAVALGDGFEPDCDQLVAVVLQPVGGQQITIAQVTMALVPEACDPNQECVPTDPTPEICDGLDNDCDGAIDEELGTTTCGVGACTSTVDNCVDGQVQTCVPGNPDTEVCDGLDNDCDGAIDEDLGTTTCGQGICQHTVDNCVAGVPQTCNPMAGAALELCDGLDNDCDGMTDEDCYCVFDLTIVSDSSTKANGVAAVPTWDQHSFWQQTSADLPDSTWIWTEYLVSQPKIDTYANFTRTVKFHPDAIGISGDIMMSTDNSSQFFVSNVLAADLNYETVYFDAPEFDLSAYLAPGSNELSWAVHNWAQPWGNAYTNPAGLIYEGHFAWMAPKSTEICDGLDNDCDGLVDEDLGTTTCGVGACIATVDNCVNGQVQTCVPGIPGTEVCDLVDNDCDGAVDEDLGTTSCGVGACAATVDYCVAGQVQTCVPGNPAAEICDLVDNDCDGAVDEALGTTTCGVGTCVATVDNCVNGQVQTCVPGAPGTEICDLVDNDCDGDIDEELGTTTCGVGECQVTVDNCAPGGPDMDAFGAGLPGQVTFVLTHPGTGFGLPSYYDVQILGTSILAGTYDDYCIDTDNYIQPGTTYTANVFSSYDALPAGIVEHPENFDLVNYIINQDYPGTPATDGNLFTYGDVQRSIWELLDDGQTTNGLGTWTQAHVDQILEEAVALGDGFEPDCDQLVGVVLQPVGGQQITIAQVTMALVPEACDPIQECVPADPTPEVCDGLDNDCDGETDEGFGTTTCGVGACTVTVDDCVAGVPQTCVPGTPSTELCNDGIDNDCDGSVDENCTCPHTIGYWKNHEENWPVEQITIGGVTYSKADAITGILKKANAKDATYQLAAQLVAAKLNILVGGPVDIQTIIDNADAFLVAHPLASNPQGAARDEALALKDQLDAYNNADDYEWCNEACEPDCLGKECGSDGCGGTCGTCDDGFECSDIQTCECVVSEEVCNGKDDDCDSLVDEDLGTTTCGVGACTATVDNCMAGVPQTCTPGTPAAETCDLVDNDCDGMVDENLGTTTCGAGVCIVTAENCVDGQVVNCQPATPQIEICDGLDNDCDGSVDEGLGTTTCGVGLCKVTVQNCVNGQLNTCTPAAPGTEVCDGKDNDCDGVIDEGLGSISCGTGACAATVQACINGQTQTCTPGTPKTEVCNDYVDNDCDGQIDEGCNVNDDCELPAGCMSLAEAFARDWIAIITPSTSSATVTLKNVGTAKVCLDEHLLFLSDPTQSFTNGIKTAANAAMSIPPGGTIALRYAPWTFANGVYQPYLNLPPWWCVEYGQLATDNTVFGYYGEQTPPAISYYIDNNTNVDGDGKEDHVDWAGSYGTQALYNIWNYQLGHRVLTAGKIAAAAGPGTVAVALISHNIGALPGTGVLVDTIPAGYTATNFSVAPDINSAQPDGSVIIGWNVTLDGFEDTPGMGSSTVFDYVEYSYDLHPALDADGKRLVLPRAKVTYNDGQTNREVQSALVVAVNVDVDGDDYPACGDCDDGNADNYPGATELCDGQDNDCDGQVDEGCPVCGNGVVEGCEMCDDGANNADEPNMCQENCTLSVMWPSSGQSTIAYEDLPTYGGNDWDYNDWVIELETEYLFDCNGITQMRLYADPWARGAAYHHSQGVSIGVGVFGSSGHYLVRNYDAQWGLTSTEPAVNFNAGQDMAIAMFDDTWVTLPPNQINGNYGKYNFDANTESGYGIMLGPKVSIEFVFDASVAGTPTEILNNQPGTHGENMPFDLYLYVANTGEYIANGDVRMLCVPDYWDWPSEKSSIWNVYAGVQSGPDGPIFEDGWYLDPAVGSTWQP